MNVHVYLTVRLSRVSITGDQILSGEMGVVISRLVLIMYVCLCVCVCLRGCVCMCVYSYVCTRVCVFECAYCYNRQALEGIDHWRSDIVR
jgi:hypothetical protein